jgi:hypothetical protein
MGASSSSPISDGRSKVFSWESLVNMAVGEGGEDNSPERGGSIEETGAALRTRGSYWSTVTQNLLISGLIQINSTQLLCYLIGSVDALKKAIP